ncbi:MAG TPA: homocysteine S-methyltransferase family protein [Thermoanaerobaculia bacterium]|nr:homocysteine S-methyltransferase family protein [Thermoanaerobaculia bacterium]
MKKNILERLEDGPVLGDGGYLLELEKRGWVRAGPFTPEVALTRPAALRELHDEFREAGAEVLQALTFYASRDKLATVGLENRLEDLNRAAVRIAREAAGDRCLVAGNISLTWMYEPDSPAAADRVRRTFDEQLAVQVDEGVDFVIGETFSFLGEALLAVERARATKLPVMVTVCFENQPVTPDGHTAADCGRALQDAGADIVGINCLRGPETTLPLIAEMRKAVKGFVACQPVGYRTPPERPDFTSLEAFPFELDPLQHSRREMARWAEQARDLGIDYIGSCCGSVAAHVREMARALGKLPQENREWKVDYSKPMSAYEYYKHQAK